MTALSERLASAWTALVGKNTPEPPPTQGEVDDPQLATLLGQWREIFQISPERMARLAEFERIDKGYIASMLRLMTFSTLTFDGNDTAASALSTNDAFKIEISGYGTSKPARIIEQVLEDTQLRDWLYPITRDIYKMGDEFIEPLVNGTDLVGIWSHGAGEMIVRRDNKGRLEKGTSQVGSDDVPLAYRQVNGAGQVLAGWYPGEILHVKFWPTMKSTYSAFSFLDPYRAAASRVEMIEEAMVVARIVRAWTRLIHRVDLTGKSPKEAEEAFKKYVRAYSMKVTPGGGAEHQLMQPDSDIFIGTGYVPDGSGKAVPKLNNVEMIDPKGSGFADIGDLTYFQKQLFAEVPAENLGLSAQAGNELTGQDIAFSSLIKYVQKKVLEKQLIRPLIDIGLELKGFRRGSVPYTLVWPNVVGAQSWKMADAQFRLGLAMTSHLQAGTSDRVFWMKRLFGLSEEQAQDEVAKGLAEKELHPIEKATSTAQTVDGSQSSGLELPDDIIKELLAPIS